MPDKEEWIAEIESLPPDFTITDKNLELMSPQFTYHDWRIGIEHQKKFEAVVLRWLADPKEQPFPVVGWLVCPRSDQQKHWIYRAPLLPLQLRALLKQLDSLMQPDVHWYQDFEVRVRSSQQDSSHSRRERLARAARIPRRIEVTTTIFERNPDVVAEVLLKANGKCEGCGAPAPFLRRANGAPYLEVHHKTPLSAGGEDTVENAVALCPNCHRRMHFA